MFIIVIRSTKDRRQPRILSRRREDNMKKESKETGGNLRGVIQWLSVDYRDYLL